VVQALLKCGWTTLRVAGDADVYFAALDLRRAIDGLCSSLHCTAAQED
jgi:hypothetical protein